MDKTQYQATDRSTWFDRLVSIYRSRSAWFWLLVILVIGITLRLIHISSEELWYDEVFNTKIAVHSSSLFEIADYARRTIHPPLYYVIARGWHYVVGFSPLAIRGLPLLFSIASLLSLYYIAKRWFGVQVAVIASLIFAITPLEVEMGQEGRPYTMIGLLALWSFYFLWRWLEKGDQRFLFLTTLLNLAGIYTHYNFFVVLGAQALIVYGLLGLRAVEGASPIAHARLKMFFSLALVGLCYIPWITFAGRYTAGNVNLYMTAQYVTMAEVFVEGHYWIFQHVNSRLLFLLAAMGQVAIALLLISGLQRLLSSNYKKITRFLFGWYVLGALLFVMMPFGSHYSSVWQRHIISLGFPLYMLTAASIYYMRRNFLLLMIGIFCLSMAGPLLYVVADNGASDIDYQSGRLMSYIKEYEQTGDAIVAPLPSIYISIEQYYDGALPVFNSYETAESYALAEQEQREILTPDQMVGYLQSLQDVSFYSADELLGRLARDYDRLWVPLAGFDTQFYGRFLADWQPVQCYENDCSKVALFEKRIFTDVK